MRRLLRMYPALLRVGFAAALAYRAEFLIWILTTNLPLINLALWSAVAREAPVAGWGSSDFVAYFLATLVVRHLTGCWVVWEMNMEIRQGTLGMRLLRPVHPLLAYSAEQLAALPLRAAFAVPVAAVLLAVTGPEHVARDPLAWAAFVLMVAGAWLMTFLVMACMGTLALYVESTYSVYEVWLGFFTVFSGYLVPLELFPGWLQALGRFLPFRLMLSLPVETALGRTSRLQMLEGLGAQALWCALLLLALRALWNAGMRRHAAYGG